LNETFDLNIFFDEENEREREKKRRFVNKEKKSMNFEDY
jgi:hypothetical protein